MSKTSIDHVHIQGFRSLAEVKLAGVPKAMVLIGANGSGKSNFSRFFEMLSWMLRSRRLEEFVERQGDADDQLYGGSRVTPSHEGKKYPCLRRRAGATRGFTWMPDPK